MERFVTDEHTGLKYELVGDYYLIAGEDEPEEREPVGIWGQRHLRYLKRYHRGRYANLLTSGKLNAYLVDIDRQAEELFLRLVKQMADKPTVILIELRWTFSMPENRLKLGFSVVSAHE